MSACVSSLIPSAIRQSGSLAATAVRSPQGLLEALSAVADPRKKRGVRHGFISILALCACAVLAGARSFIAIAEWAMDLTPLVEDASLPAADYVLAFVDRFRADVEKRLKALGR